MKVAIVGAGFSGIATARQLALAGHEFTIFERADDVGGVWQANTYPGAACDVPSYLYSFSWAQHRDWSRPCSPQEEIQGYLRAVAEEHGILEHIRFGTEVTETRWDGDALNWTLELAGGERVSADALVLACGQLSQPAYPEIPGADTFGGHAFHSAHWDHDHDLSGRRVAVIGTGASAIQFVPAIAAEVGHMDVYQRSAPYILPRTNPRYPRAVVSAIRHVPGLQQARRYGMWGVMETMILGYSKSPALKSAFRAWSTAFMRRQLTDPEVRAKVWPDHEFGCKRILFSSYYLPALQRDNVEVITDHVERITPTGVVTADGRERPVDTIIWGTGFRADKPVLPMRVHGIEQELQESWAQAPHAHLGITVHGFPNLFLMYGPNTNLGVGSIIVMLEAQAKYVTQALELVAQNDAALDVREEVELTYNNIIQHRLANSVYTKCQSWYRKDGTGQVIGNWPGFMLEYVRSVDTVNPQDFALVRAPVSETATA